MGVGGGGGGGFVSGGELRDLYIYAHLSVNRKLILYRFIFIFFIQIGSGDPWISIRKNTRCTTTSNIVPF